MFVDEFVQWENSGRLQPRATQHLALQKDRDGEDMDAQIEPRFKDDHLVATVDERGQDTQDRLRAP